MNIATPFPELKAFESSPRLPSLETLLASLPREVTPTAAAVASETRFPTFPSKQIPPAKRTTRRVPMVSKPLPSGPSGASEAREKEGSGKQTTQSNTPPMPSPFALAVTAAMDDDDDQFGKKATDEDLCRALEPIVESSLEQVLYSPDKGLHTYLEPMLRSTVRRAIAEQVDASVQFRATGTVDRVGWRLKALMTSRSYDEVVFHSTRRYQVEEAFLLRKEDFSLVSFASHDPARHASEKRVTSTVHMLVSRLADSEGRLRKTFEMGDDRVGIVRAGKHTILVAIVRGRSNALVRADLDYVLRQAEERFGERLEDETDAFLHVLQPILEGCLLIQSPAPPN